MLKSIELLNWRNQKKFKSELDQFTIFLGLNASGKTNILESIYYTSELGSWRTNNDEDLVNWDCDYFEINLKLLREEKENIRIFFQNNQVRNIKKIEINQIPRTRKYLNSVIRTVLFSPDQIEQLLTPGGRRQYLNQFLIQKDYHYSVALREYNKVVRAKNIILSKLKEGFGSKQELDFWNIKLVEAAQVITDIRRDWFRFVNTYFISNYNLTSGSKEKVVVEFYLKNPPEKLLKKINENIFKEIQAGVTLYGPHRDDWGIILKGHDLTKSGSRGEWRSVLVSFKLLEAQYLTIEENKPIILLDDLLSELDDQRKNNFFKQISDYQVILTSAEDSNLKILPNLWKVVKING